MKFIWLWVSHLSAIVHEAHEMARKKDADKSAQSDHNKNNKSEPNDDEEPNFDDPEGFVDKITDEGRSYPKIRSTYVYTLMVWHMLLIA